MIKNLLGKAANWLKGVGTRNESKPKTNIVKETAPTTPKAERKLPAYQKAQREWDERLARSRRLVWISLRWERWTKKLDHLVKRKTLRMLNKDGSILAFAVGKTFNAGRNAERRRARAYVKGNKMAVTPRDMMLHARAERQRQEAA